MSADSGGGPSDSSDAGTGPSALWASAQGGQQRQPYDPGQWWPGGVAPEQAGERARHAAADARNRQLAKHQRIKRWLGFAALASGVAGLLLSALTVNSSSASSGSGASLEAVGGALVFIAIVLTVTVLVLKARWDPRRLVNADFIERGPEQSTRLGRARELWITATPGQRVESAQDKALDALASERPPDPSQERGGSPPNTPPNTTPFG